MPGDFGWIYAGNMGDGYNVEPEKFCNGIETLDGGVCAGIMGVRCGKRWEEWWCVDGAATKFAPNFQAEYAENGPQISENAYCAKFDIRFGRWYVCTIKNTGIGFRNISYPHSEREVFVMSNTNEIMEMLKQMNAKIDGFDARLSKLESGKTSKKSSPKQKSTKTSKKSSTNIASTNLDDYAPTNWTEYTKLRRKYSYAVCVAETGENYDEAVFKRASAEYRDEYYDTLK